MPTTPPLDIERIIRAARLRSSREPLSALTVMLFQALRRRSPDDCRLRMNMLADEGRSVQEWLHGIEYQGTLWSIHGQGDWEWIKNRTLSRNVQTWKNPVLRPLPEQTEAMICQQLGSQGFMQEALLARIEKAVADEEARVLGLACAQPIARRAGPRL